MQPGLMPEEIKIVEEATQKTRANCNVMIKKER